MVLWMTVGMASPLRKNKGGADLPAGAAQLETLPP
jgi:hypothetical protein